jgi:cytochrome c oxidase subunit II
MIPEKRKATVYLYDLAWILPAIAIPVGMLAAFAVTAFGAGVHLPIVEGREVPIRVAEAAPFDTPGVRQIGPGRYEVTMTAQVWAFAPNEIRVPAGSSVTFVATSKDVVHGLLIPKANVNTLLLPGQVSRVTARFDTPGEYPFFCHEYCGLGHQMMRGRVIVQSNGS